MERGYALTGHRLNPTYSLTKAMWVRDHEPEVFARAEHLVLAKDYAVHRLTGELVTDPSDASSTNAYDQKAGEWSAEILDAAEIDRALLPEVVASSTVVGPVTRGGGARDGPRGRDAGRAGRRRRAVRGARRRDRVGRVGRVRLPRLLVVGVDGGDRAAARPRDAHDDLRPRDPRALRADGDDAGGRRVVRVDLGAAGGDARGAGRGGGRRARRRRSSCPTCSASARRTGTPRARGAFIGPAAPPRPAGDRPRRARGRRVQPAHRARGVRGDGRRRSSRSTPSAAARPATRGCRSSPTCGASRCAAARWSTRPTRSARPWWAASASGCSTPSTSRPASRRSAARSSPTPTRHERYGGAARAVRRRLPRGWRRSSMSSDAVVVTSRSFGSGDADPAGELRAAGLDVVKGDPAARRAAARRRRRAGSPASARSPPRTWTVRRDCG